MYLFKIGSDNDRCILGNELIKFSRETNTFLKAGLTSLVWLRQLSSNLLNAFGVSVLNLSIAGLRKPQPTMNRIWTKSIIARMTSLCLSTNLILVADVTVRQRPSQQLVQNNSWRTKWLKYTNCQCLNVPVSQCLSVSVSSEFQCLSVYQMHKHLTGMCRGCHHSFLSLLAPSIVCCLSVAGNNFTCKANLQWGVTCHLFVFLTRARPARLHRGQTEVSDFDGEVVVVQKYIVWFKVPGRCRLVISKRTDLLPVNYVFGM